MVRDQMLREAIELASRYADDEREMRMEMVTEWRNIRPTYADYVAAKRVLKYMRRSQQKNKYPIN